jgi:peptidoglycan/xylan/chitin deacetylase (PgdA/CDA1 family)
MISALPILTFHALDDPPAVTSFSPRLFRRGMARLHENGYRTLTLLEAVDYLRHGRLFPDRSFVITFDDGYQRLYAEAVAVLQNYGMYATVFLTVGEAPSAESAGRLPALGGRSMLSWREIREMSKTGFSFGAHTLTHPDLTHLPVERIETEICRSKEIIEDALGDPVRCFAYPYGRYDRRSREIVQRYFVCACSDKLGLTRTDSDPYTLERVDAYYLRTDRLFDLLLTKMFPWYIAACSVPRRIRRSVQLS